MSSSEALPGASDLADCLAQAAAGLAAAVADPDRVSDEALQNLIGHAVRLYAVKAEAGLSSPFPRRGGVTVDDVMIAATDMLHALNVQLFELSMWQAMTGHCIKRSDRADFVGLSAMRRREQSHLSSGFTHDRLRTRRAGLGSCSWEEHMNVMTPIVLDPAHEEFDTRTLLAHAAQQAEDRHYEDFMIIDVDAHHHENSSYKEIFDYIDDPVMRDQFKYSRGATLQPRSTGGYQEMAGRITRYQHRPAKRRPVLRTAISASPASGWIAWGRCGLRLSDADAGPRPQSGRGSRGRLRTRL